jgi:hypothetical protein
MHDREHALAWYHTLDYRLLAGEGVHEPFLACLIGTVFRNMFRPGIVSRLCEDMPAHTTIVQVHLIEWWSGLVLSCDTSTSHG